MGFKVPKVDAVYDMKDKKSYIQIVKEI